MKHRHLFGLLGAAAVALGSFPAFPVSAADEPAFTSSCQVADGYRTIISTKGEDGTCETDFKDDGAFSFTWDGIVNTRVQYSACESEHDQSDVLPPKVVYAGTFDLGDYGYFGVCGSARTTDSAGNVVEVASFSIVEGWGLMSNVRLQAGEKLGDITVGGVQYEVFRSVTRAENAEQDIVSYRSIRNLNQCSGRPQETVEGIVPVDEHLSKLAAFGLPYQKYSGTMLYVDSGEKEDGRVSGSVNITRNTMATVDNSPSACKSGTTEDGYAWWHERSGAGSSAFCDRGNGRFYAEWTDASLVSVGSGSDFPFTPFWDQLDDLRYEYACTADVSSGSAFMGVSGILKDSNAITDFRIVDGWSGDCPPITENGEPLGEITVDGIVYDVYYLNATQESIAGTSPYIYQFWSVRRENAMTEAGTLKNTVPVRAHLEAYRELKSDKVCRKLFRIAGSADSAGGAGTAAVTFTKNNSLTDPYADTGAYFRESGRNGGYTWERIQKGMGIFSGITPEENGNFSAEWTDVSPEENVLFRSGIRTDQIQSTDHLEYLGGDYSLTCELKGNAFFGIACTFMDISSVSANEPDTMECYLIDGWGTWRPTLSSDYKRGTISVEGEDSDYDVYLLPINELTQNLIPVTPLETTKEQCLIVRQENKCTPNHQSKVRAAHNMKKVFDSISELGIQLPAWRDAAVFVQAQDGSGSVKTAAVALSYTYECLDQGSMDINLTGLTDDGYTWEHWSSRGRTGSVMTPGTDGTFTCSWENTIDSFYWSGKRLPEETAWNNIKKIRCDYEMDLESTGNACAGIYGYLTNYNTEYYIIDAWTGSETPIEALPSAFRVTELGEITVDGALYDTYVAVNTQMDILGNRAIPIYYSIRRENLAANGRHISNSVDVSAHLTAWDQHDMGAKYLALVSLMAQAGCSADRETTPTGSATITKNEITFSESEKSVQSLKPSVKGDANCDGGLDVADAVLVARVVNEDASAVISDQGIANGDVDGQNGLSAADITILLQAIAKKIRF